MLDAKLEKFVAELAEKQGIDPEDVTYGAMYQALGLSSEVLESSGLNKAAAEILAQVAVLMNEDESKAEELVTLLVERLHKPLVMVLANVLLSGVLLGREA